EKKERGLKRRAPTVYASYSGRSQRPPIARECHSGIQIGHCRFPHAGVCFPETGEESAARVSSGERGRRRTNRAILLSRRRSVSDHALSRWPARQLHPKPALHNGPVQVGEVTESAAIHGRGGRIFRLRHGSDDGRHSENRR